MRFMMIVKANEESESGRMPTTEEFEEMAAYNEELARAGVMRAGEGLHPSSRGFRVDFNGETPAVIDGPFTETKELVAGFWIIEVNSREEAVEWARKVPFREGVLEIRQIFETDDFGDSLTPELREREERLRAEYERQGQ